MFMPQAQSANLSLICRIDSDVPDRLVGDSVRLRQVLLNLISKALKFTTEGFVRLLVHRIGSKDSQVTLRFEVEDSGIGIAQSKQQLIFEAFHQADATVTRRFGGTGLGLAICSRLVSLMNGTLDLHSREGEGTRIWFELSFQVGENSPQPESLPDQLQGALVLAAAPRPEGRESLRQLLETCGFAEVKLATSVDEVLRLHKLQTPGLVVLDAFAEEECERVARALEGKIPHIFNPQPRDGASLRIPFTRRSLLRALRRAVVNPSEAQSQETLPQRPLRILVVEDNVISQTVMRLMLGEQGHGVELATTGKEAVAMLEQSAFDLVLMDMQMPEMNGLEATNHIRLRERETGRPRSTIVALTARAQDSDRKACLQAGMDGYLTKPVHSTELSAILAGIA